MNVKEDSAVNSSFGLLINRLFDSELGVVGVFLVSPRFFTALSSNGWLLRVFSSLVFFVGTFFNGNTFEFLLDWFFSFLFCLFLFLAITLLDFEARIFQTCVDVLVFRLLFQNVLEILDSFLVFSTSKASFSSPVVGFEVGGVKFKASLGILNARSIAFKFEIGKGTI
jgi:hypothetical protein